MYNNVRISVNGKEIFLKTKFIIEQICRHEGVEVDPDERDNDIDKDMANDVKILENFIGKHFLCVQTKPSIRESCIYTVR